MCIRDRYKAVYDVLNERRQTTPGFCYHDRSGWRAYSQTYMTMQCPLWIIAEDAATGRRLWITQEGTRFSISIRRMDEQGRNYGPTYRITCENRTKPVSYTHLDVYKRQMYNQNSDLMKQEKFMLPTMIEGDFSAEELAEDADGLQMSFQRVKIPAGGTLQFEMPSDDPDNPDYEKTLVGVILHNHATCAYWPAGSEYDDDTTPLCSSVDGKVGIGTCLLYTSRCV